MILDWTSFQIKCRHKLTVEFYFISTCGLLILLLFVVKYTVVFGQRRWLFDLGSLRIVAVCQINILAFDWKTLWDNDFNVLVAEFL